jgi:hypothetical protein
MPRVIVRVGEVVVEIDLVEFLEQNSFDPDEVAEIEAAIERDETYRGGGGAAPAWQLELVR